MGSTDSKEKDTLENIGDYNIYVGAVEGLDERVMEEIKGKKYKNITSLEEIGSLGNYISDENLFSLPINQETGELPESDNFSLVLMSEASIQEEDTEYFSVILRSNIQYVRGNIPLSDVQYIFRYMECPKDFPTNSENFIKWINSKNVLEKSLCSLSWIDFRLDSFSEKEVIGTLKKMYPNIENDYNVNSIQELSEEVKNSPKDMVYKFGMGLLLAKEGEKYLRENPKEGERVLNGILQYCAQVLKGCGFKSNSDIYPYILKRIYKGDMNEDIMIISWFGSDEGRNIIKNLKEVIHRIGERTG